MDWIPQVGIMIFGCTAIWLVSRPEKWRRWAFIIGLCSQPFWYWTAYHNKQWGILVLSVWYTYSWIQGLYFHWIKKGTNNA